MQIIQDKLDGHNKTVNELVSTMHRKTSRDLVLYAIFLYSAVATLKDIKSDKDNQIPKLSADKLSPAMNPEIA